jgi:hypothetical protein
VRTATGPAGRKYLSGIGDRGAAEQAFLGPKTLTLYRPAGDGGKSAAYLPDSCVSTDDDFSRSDWWKGCA